MTTAELDQAMSALERANHVRLTRARIKREVFEGRSVDDLILDPPPELEGMPVVQLVTAMRRVGRHRALRILQPLCIHERRPLGKLTERQRAELVGAIHRRTNAQATGSDPSERESSPLSSLPFVAGNENAPAARQRSGARPSEVTR